MRKIASKGCSFWPGVGGDGGIAASDMSFSCGANETDFTGASSIIADRRAEVDGEDSQYRFAPVLGARVASKLTPNPNDDGLWRRASSVGTCYPAIRTQGSTT
jgi:hypothetical protein